MVSVRWKAAQQARYVDLALFVFAAGLGALAAGTMWHDHGLAVNIVSLAAGALACLALWVRRSRPLPVALLATAAATFSPLALGAALAAICTAASRTAGRALFPIVAAAAVASVTFPVVNPSAGETLTVGVPTFLLTVAAFGWGLYLRTRRELVASLHERALRLETDQRRAAETAREAERRRIAREMHDVLAHRLSLLSVHAGALEFRPDAPPADVAQAASVIRASAAAALGELRQVISVLREPTEDGAEPPQPGLEQLADLLEESRSAGMPLSARLSIPAGAAAPPLVGRTVYRVVQAGLTNARKHAPGAAVEVTVLCGASGLTAEILSARPSSPAPAALPGCGLIGLSERLTLVGGTLEHGPTLTGGFLLRATITAAAA